MASLDGVMCAVTFWVAGSSIAGIVAGSNSTFQSVGALGRQDVTLVTGAVPELETVSWRSFWGRRWRTSRAPGPGVVSVSL